MAVATGYATLYLGMLAVMNWRVVFCGYRYRRMCEEARATWFGRGGEND
jgi:hypothetical protein